jgi:uncharacterized protein (TIGR03435 family)
VRRHVARGMLMAIALPMTASLLAQGGVNAATNVPRFAVVSVKRGQAAAPTTDPMSMPGGSFEMANVPVQRLIGYAYQRKWNEIVELPKWAAMDVFTIRAKADGNPPGEQMRAMVRTLLAERFKFAAHDETRPIQLWALTVARKDGTLGSSLVRRAEPCDRGDTVTIRSRTIRCPGFLSWPGGVAIAGMPITVLGDLIGNLFLDLKVVDRTGLGGLYDATLDSGAQSTTGPANDIKLPLLLTAIEDQLGLKLDLQREPTPVMVVERIEPPTED